jgi:hypothetical protein
MVHSLLVILAVLSVADAQSSNTFLVHTTYYATSTCTVGTDIGYILTKVSPGPCVPVACQTVTDGFVTVTCPTEFPAPYDITTTTYTSVSMGHCPGLNIQGLSYFGSQFSWKRSTCIPDNTFQTIANFYGLPNYVLGQWPGRQFQCYNDIFSLAYQNFPIMDTGTGTCAGNMGQGQILFQQSAGTPVASMYKCTNSRMSTGCGVSDCFHENTTITYGEKELSMSDLQHGGEPECEIPHIVIASGVVIGAKCGAEKKVLRLTGGHLLYTQRGLQKAEDVTEEDTLFSDMEERESCQVLSNERNSGRSKYFGLNCHNSQVLASGIKSSTFEKLHSVPSFWMRVMGKVLGIKRASGAGDYIASLASKLQIV